MLAQDLDGGTLEAHLQEVVAGRCQENRHSTEVNEVPNRKVEIPGTFFPFGEEDDVTIVGDYDELYSDEEEEYDLMGLIEELHLLDGAYLICMDGEPSCLR